jgi:hypothetical protein
MKKRRRRFEVLLPLQFNDGRAVPRSWLTDAKFEMTPKSFDLLRVMTGRTLRPIAGGLGNTRIVGGQN